MAELRFTFSGGEDDQRFVAQLRQFAGENSWSSAITNEVELIFEEWLTNVRDYGLTAQPHPEIRVTVWSKADVAEIEVMDNGIPFNPTQQKDPDITLPAEQRPIGGLGIFMMKKLSRSMRYERNDPWNLLVIEKDLRKPILTP